MTAATTSAARGPAGLAPLDRACLLAWLGFCLIVTVYHVAAPQRFFLEWDSDSLMRLQQVRDLLHGQGWFDLRQYRLGGASGASMHWTRFADLGPAALIALFEPLAGARQAEHWAATLYAPILFLPFLWLSARTALQLAPAPSRSLLGLSFAGVALLSPPLLVNFQPGNLDHHNLQLVALALFLRAVTGERGRREGALAAVAVIFGLVVGVDAAPVILAASGALMALWAWRPAAEGPFVASFGRALLFCLALASPLFLAHPLRFDVCDSFTPPMALLFTAYGGLWLAITPLFGRLTTPVLRFAAGAGFGALAATAVLLMFPACRDPIPLHDPLIWRYWMNVINENRSVVEYASETPARLIGLYGPLLAAGVGLRRLTRAGKLELGRFAPLLAATLAAAGLTALHVRAWPMLLATLLPVLALLLAEARLSPSLARRLTPWLLFAPALHVAFGRQIEAAAPAALSPRAHEAAPHAALDNYCLTDALVERIARLPRGVIIASLDLSPLLIVHTPHRLLAATYHRNAQVNLSTLRWWVADAGRALALSGLPAFDYVVTCPNDSMLARMAHEQPQGMAARLLAHTPPAWLEPALPLAGGGMVWRRVAPAGGAGA